LKVSVLIPLRALIPLRPLYFATTAGSQEPGELAAIAAITRSAADFQPTSAGHYCAGTLADISAAIITSRSAVACTHEVIGGNVISGNPWLYPCS
jgi:hypothetical protein